LLSNSADGTSAKVLPTKLNSNKIILDHDRYNSCGF
jgi:hypothetical protein